MAARTVDCPEEDWLDIRDMTRLTRLSERTIDRLVSDGVFPPPRQVTARLKFWYWEDYLYWTLRVKIFGVPESDEPPEPAAPEKISRAGSRQERSQPGQ